MCRISRSSGISRCSLLVLLLLLCVSGKCRGAEQFFWQAAPAGLVTSYMQGADAVGLASQFADADASALAAQCGSSSVCYSGAVNGVQCSPSGAPTASGQSSACTWQMPEVNGPGCVSGQCVQGAGYSAGSVTLESYACSSYPQDCATPLCTAGQAQTFGGTSGSAPGTVCSGGCEYQQSGVGVVVPGMSGWGQGYAATGATCGGGDTSGATQGANCVSGPGGTFCVQTQGSGAGQCGTVNGNQVCPGAIKADNCVVMSDGSEACATSAPGSAATTPPAPDNGTAGTPATPTATVSVSGSGGTTNVVNYYSSSVVSSSTVGTVGASGGANVGNGGSSGSGSGSGQGQCGASGSPCSVVNANASGDGDCSVAGDCSTGANPMPTYDWSSDSWSGALTSFWNSVSGGPIAASLSAISSAWPDSGSCPSETVSLATINYTADYGTEFCGLWASDAVPVLQAVMLAVWSIVAVFIFLSA